MAKNINLVPQEVKKEQAKEKVVKRTTIVAILFTLAVGIFAGYLFVKKQLVVEKIEDLNQSIENLRASIVEMKDIEIKARTLDKQYTAVSSLLQDRVRYSLLMDELNKRKPSSVQIDSFNTSGKTEINISGKADNYLAISEFVNNLSNNDFSGGNESLKTLFKEVTLNSVNLDSQSDKARFFIVVETNTDLLQLKGISNGN